MPPAKIIGQRQRITEAPGRDKILMSMIKETTLRIVIDGSINNVQTFNLKLAGFIISGRDSILFYGFLGSAGLSTLDKRFNVGYELESSVNSQWIQWVCGEFRFDQGRIKGSILPCRLSPNDTALALFNDHLDRPEVWGDRYSKPIDLKEEIPKQAATEAAA